MIQILGVRHDVGLETREKLSIVSKRIERSLKKLNDLCSEVIILSTCNRTEIYFKSDYSDVLIKEKIFDSLDWDKELMASTFYLKEDEAIEHLMDVVCGFDSIIFGEEQILGQIRMAYDQAVQAKSVKSEFRRLFDTAIACGREFREQTKLYKIPVSSASIVVDEARKRGIKRFMILGFGGVGALVEKYISGIDFEKLYIATREEKDINTDDDRVEFVSFKERQSYYDDVECIITATSAPHTVMRKADVEVQELLIFDLAVPRDVEDDVYEIPNIEVYNVDNINVIDDENHMRRKLRMTQYRYIIK